MYIQEERRRKRIVRNRTGLSTSRYMYIAVYECTFIYIFTYMCVYVYTCIREERRRECKYSKEQGWVADPTFTYMCAYVYTCIREERRRECKYSKEQVWVADPYMYKCICVYEYICMNIYVHIYVYIYMHIYTYVYKKSGSASARILRNRAVLLTPIYM